MGFPSAVGQDGHEIHSEQGGTYNHKKSSQRQISAGQGCHPASTGMESYAAASAVDLTRPQRVQDR